MTPTGNASTSLTIEGGQIDTLVMNLTQTSGSAITTTLNTNGIGDVTNNAGGTGDSGNVTVIQVVIQSLGPNPGIHTLTLAGTVDEEPSFAATITVSVASSTGGIGSASGRKPGTATLGLPNHRISDKDREEHQRKYGSAPNGDSTNALLGGQATIQTTLTLSLPTCAERATSMARSLGVADAGLVAEIIHDLCGAKAESARAPSPSQVAVWKTPSLSFILGPIARIALNPLSLAPAPGQTINQFSDVNEEDEQTCEDILTSQGYSADVAERCCPVKPAGNSPLVSGSTPSGSSLTGTTAPSGHGAANASQGEGLTPSAVPETLQFPIRSPSTAIQMDASRAVGQAMINASPAAKIGQSQAEMICTNYQAATRYQLTYLFGNHVLYPVIFRCETKNWGPLFAAQFFLDDASQLYEDDRSIALFSEADLEFWHQRVTSPTTPEEVNYFIGQMGHRLGKSAAQMGDILDFIYLNNLPR
ncbi:MAG: hypothetical protein Q8P95_03250 [bacterium]|nr:hypothetical protein [bacterium]